MSLPETFQVGWVYVLGHPEWEGSRVKIGMTTRRVENRIEELNTTSMLPPEAYLAFAALVRSPFEVEASLHDELQQYRVDSKRELFSLSEYSAVAAIFDHLKYLGVDIIDKTGLLSALSAVDPGAVEKRRAQIEREKLEREAEQIRLDAVRLEKFLNLDAERQIVENEVENFCRKYRTEQPSFDGLSRRVIDDLERELRVWEGFPTCVETSKRATIEARLLAYNKLLNECTAEREACRQAITILNWVAGRELASDFKFRRIPWLGTKAHIPSRYICVLEEASVNLPRRAPEKWRELPPAIRALK